MGKTALFFKDDLGDALRLFYQFRVGIFHQVADGHHHLMHERLGCAEQASVANAATENFAQHVSTTFICRQYAI